MAGRSRAEVRRLDQLFTVIDVSAGTVLGRQGELCREFMIVLGGEVAVLHDDAPLAVLPANSHFGAAPLLNPTQPFRLVSCHALGPARLAVATASEFRSMLATLPEVSRRITNLAGQRQAYFDGMAAGRQTTSAPAERQRFPIIDVEVAV